MLKNLVEKVQHNKAVQKLLAVVMCMSLVFAVCAVNADEGSGSSYTPTVNAVTASDYAPVIQAFQSAVTPQMIIAILAVCAVVGIGFVVMWFGYGKIKSAFQRAFKRGKL